MELKPTEQQEMLLYKACKEHQGTVPVTLARQMYSSKSSAHSAIDRLELAGYIEYMTPGYFKVVKVTRDVKEQLKMMEENSSSNEDDGKGSNVSESSFEIVQQ